MAIWRYFGKKQRINFPIYLKMSIFALRLEKVTNIIGYYQQQGE